MPCRTCPPKGLPLCRPYKTIHEGKPSKKPQPKGCDLERLTKPGERAQNNVNIDATLKASAQFAKGGEPSMCAFDHPAMAPKLLIALHALAGDAALDALAVRDEVALAAELASIRGIGACEWAPGAGYADPIHAESAQIQLVGGA